MTRRKPEPKAEIPLDKNTWQPSLLAGPIVLISSRSNLDECHAASKSWVTMVASRPPMLAFCCRLSHRTAINVLETREFVVNIPGDDLVSRVWSAGDSVAAAPEGGDAPQWTWVPSIRVSAPRIQECRGHIECVLDSSKRFNDEEMIFFGRIVGVSIDASLLKGLPEERYRSMKSLLYLEGDLYFSVDGARKLPT